MNTQPRMTSEYQRAVSEFVGREVHACVSMLVSHLAQDCEGEYYDDILSICVQDDYQTAAEDAGWSTFTDEFGAACYRDSTDDQTWAGGNWLDLCEVFVIEPYIIEALEHWIVSDWLANELNAAGEMVNSDIYGLTIWGRRTSGQAISMDAVICDIYDSLK